MFTGISPPLRVTETNWKSFSSPSAPAHEFSLSRRFGQDCPVLFQGTFEQRNCDEKLKVKKRKDGTKSKTKYNLEKWQNCTVICLANALNVRARWKCHRKTNTEKNTGSTNKNSLNPKTIETREIRGGGGVRLPSKLPYNFVIFQIVLCFWFRSVFSFLNLELFVTVPLFKSSLKKDRAILSETSGQRKLVCWCWGRAKRLRWPCKNPKNQTEKWSPYSRDVVGEASYFSRNEVWKSNPDIFPVLQLRAVPRVVLRFVVNCIQLTSSYSRNWGKLTK